MRRAGRNGGKNARRHDVCTLRLPSEPLLSSMVQMAAQRAEPLMTRHPDDRDQMRSSERHAMKPALRCARFWK
jgi:hypothetical protein